jgi:uncharacterized membrane protein
MMPADTATFPPLAAILAMAAATYALRAGGFWLMRHVPLTTTVQRMLEALPGSVIVATILPIGINGGVSATVSIAAAGAVMIVLRNDFLAVIAGIAAVTGLRAFGV